MDLKLIFIIGICGVMICMNSIAGAPQNCITIIKNGVRTNSCSRREYRRRPGPTSNCITIIRGGRYFHKTCQIIFLANFFECSDSHPPCYEGVIMSQPIKNLQNSKKFAKKAKFWKYLIFRCAQDIWLLKWIWIIWPFPTPDKSTKKPEFARTTWQICYWSGRP